MKANELVIGDWVNYAGFPYQVTELKFKGITDERRISLADGNSGYINIPLSERITPLPLTPEILEKNFPNTDDGVIWWKEDGIKGFWIEIEYGLSKFMASLDYVHELQHALRLCGIEQDIKI